MTSEQARAVVLRQLAAIAPEAELSTLDPEADVREALDLDSMDVLRFATALHDELGVEIPESAYGRITSVRKCVDYLCAATASASR